VNQSELKVRYDKFESIEKRKLWKRYPIFLGSLIVLFLIVSHLEGTADGLLPSTKILLLVAFFGGMFFLIFWSSKESKKELRRLDLYCSECDYPILPQDKDHVITKGTCKKCGFRIINEN